MALSDDLVGQGAAELRIGTELDSRYEIQARIGSGGAGTVYEAYDRQVEDVVALKVLHANTADARARFRREVRLARRVTHQHVARIYDIGELGELHYLTMEFVRGQSLSDVIANQGTLPASRVITLGLQIASGLAAAHAAGVLHRDLKPANILLDPDGRSVITDFGLARRATPGDAGLTGDNVGLIGTPAYMSPEQLEGATVGEATDIYALGLVLYEMATGVRPFSGRTPLAIAFARLEKEAPDPRKDAAVPDGLAQLIRACLNRDPQCRPVSADRVAELLAGIGDGTSDAVTSPSSPSSRFVRIGATDRSVAVMPFRARDRGSDAYLAEALTDELVDVLSMTRGIRVKGAGATARFADQRDAQKIGRQLGVDALVEGTIARQADALRISARLIDVETGFQLWSDRFGGELTDIFDLEDRLAKQLAEALRIELQTIDRRGEVSAEAVELYLRARSLMRRIDMGGPEDGAIAYLERALELAPDFPPAVALHAIACVRAWFFPGFAGARDWAQEATRATERALTIAPELVETQFAAARLYLNTAEFRRAALGIRRALEIVPTYPAAHELLGRLQCEAGRPREGLEHLRLAASLEPDDSSPVLGIAYYYAVTGQTEAFEAALADLRPHRDNNVVITMLELRYAAWHGDLARARACFERLGPIDSGIKVATHELARGFLGELKDDEVNAFFIAFSTQVDNPRFMSFVLQLSAEVLALRGRSDLAEHCLTRAAEAALIDIAWLENCPALAPLRKGEAYAAAHRTVTQRIQGMWS